MRPATKTVMLMLALLPGCCGLLAQSPGNGATAHGPLNWMLQIPDWLDQLRNKIFPPPPPPRPPAGFGWTVKCEDGVLVIYGYYEHYPGVNASNPDVGRMPTNIPCEDQESTDPNGNRAPNANSAAPVQNTPQTPAQGSNPSPPPAQGKGGKAVAKLDGPASLRGVTPAANSASGAFTFTLPYRELGIVPFAPENSPNPTVSCASRLNPTAFFVDHIQGNVTRYNLCTGDPVAVINVTSHPLQVRVTPDGAQAIVTSFDNAITFIDTATNQITKVLQPGASPSGLAIASDGSYALVTNYDSAGVALLVVDIPSKSVIGTIPLDGIFPQSVFLNPDNTLAWVTYPWTNVVEAIDILTGTVTRSLSILNPFDVAFSPNGTRAYVASGAGSVKIIDTGTYQTIASVPAGPGACDLQVSPDGHIVSVNNYLGKSFTLFDARSPSSAVTIPSGEFPRGAATVPVE